VGNSRVAGEVSFPVSWTKNGHLKAGRRGRHFWVDAGAARKSHLVSRGHPEPRIAEVPSTFPCPGNASRIKYSDIICISG
jgi:hypothetical protein